MLPNNLPELLDELVANLRGDSSSSMSDLLELYDVLKQCYRLVDNHAEIPLTHGYWSKVSLEDLDRVLAHKWHAVGTGTLAHPIIAKAKIQGRSVALHRFLLDLATGDPRKADHVNYDNLDNRRENLRIVSNVESAQHRRGWVRRSAEINSIHKGVYFRTDKKYRKPWRAVIKKDGVPIHLGNFATDTEAAAAYNKAALEFHGEFAELNDVGEANTKTISG